MKDQENIMKKVKDPDTSQRMKQDIIDMRDVYNFKRAQKIKLLFAHHCNIQMFIHAKSLEIYANMHQKVQSVDVAEELMRKHPNQPNMVKLLREQGHQVNAMQFGSNDDKIKIKFIQAADKSILVEEDVTADKTI